MHSGNRQELAQAVDRAPLELLSEDKVYVYIFRPIISEQG